MRRAPLIAAAATAVALLAVLVAGLLHSEPRLAGTNSVRPLQPVATLAPRATCQVGEIVPEGAATVEIDVQAATPAPRLAAEIRTQDGRTLTRGVTPAGAGTGRLEIPISPVKKSVAGAAVCLRTARTGGAVRVLGQAGVTGHIEVRGKPRPGDMRLAYRRAGSESWLALAPTIAHRSALAKTRLAGAWLFWVVLGLIGAGAITGVAVALTGGSVRRVATACAVVAVLNGVAWSLLLPPLQAHDEPVHVYYTQRLAESGKPPRPILGTVITDDENAVMNSVRLFDVVGNRDGRPPWTQLEDASLDRTLASGLSKVSDGADGGVGVYPPLYYGLGAVAYRLTPGDSLLDRMELMRLVSALLAGVTAVFVCLFVRELLPGRPWAWATAGVVAAFQPVFAYMSGAFNPDIGVAAAGAVLFWAIARGFRRGLTPALGVALGLAVSLGFLAKLSFAGLIPGAALATLLLVWRRRAWVAAVVTLAAALVPVAVYAYVNVRVWDRPALVGASAPGGSVTGGSGGGGGGGAAAPGFSRREALVYVWQSYLPRLPFMNDRFADYPIWNRYFKTWVGNFGWGDYGFPPWIFSAALAVGLILLAGAVALALRHRARFAARWPEWLSYAVLAGGLLFLLGWTGYDFVRKTGTGFEQGRYLLPLHALYAGIVAAGLRGFGVRAGPIVAAVLVVLAAGAGVWAELMTIARFYG